MEGFLYSNNVSTHDVKKKHKDYRKKVSEYNVKRQYDIYLHLLLFRTTY